MPFTPTYDNLPEREPMKAVYHNTLIDDLQAALSSIDGVDMASPLTLSRSAQHLNGAGHYIYGFKKWFGAGGSDNCLRDVTGYGVTGDGSTDDTAAIQSAIDDCGVNGGAILFPPGVYLVGEEIHLAGSLQNKNNISLIGSGWATELKLKNASNCRILRMGVPGSPRQNMEVSGIKFNGNSANQTDANSLIDLNGTLRAKVKMCRVTASKGTGIDVGDSADAMVSSCLVDTNTLGGVFCDMEAGSGLILTRTTMAANKYGVHFTPSPKNGVVTNCIARSNTVHGIYIASTASSSCEQFVLGGNQISVNGAGAAGSGIHIESGFSDSVVRNFVISKNVCRGNIINGLQLHSGPGEIKNFAVSVNQCTMNGTDGILANIRTRMGAISRNTCTENAQTVSTGVGIFLLGVRSAGIDYLSLVGNTLADGDATPTQKYGLYMDAGTYRCVVLGNVFYGNVTAPVFDGGTDNDIAHNPGY
jgi:hypothetical protein